MTTTAQSIIKQAQELLQDTTGVRWSAVNLVAHLNDGQRALVELRPEMFAATVPIALVAGAKQTIPSTVAKLLEIPRNTSGAAIFPVERAQLDAVEPTWYTKTGVTTIKHTTHDLREPHVFYVYPPAALGASVDAVGAVWPADVATPAGPLATNVSGNIDCKDDFKNALLHFVVSRALMADAEDGNAALAASHAELFSAHAGGSAPAIANKD
jgi:hypothetical protein